MNKRWRPLSRLELARAVGQRLSEIRRGHGWRPERLATMLEIPRPLLERYERGETLVPTYTLYQLSGALNVDIQEILGGPAVGIVGPGRLDDVLQRLEGLAPSARLALLDFLNTTIAAIERWSELPRER